MELLIYIANALYLVAYAVRDILHLRVLTIVATCCLAVYFYNQAQPMMTVVYWNIFFLAINSIQLGRIYKERMRSGKDESSADEQNDVNAGKYIERLVPLQYRASAFGDVKIAAPQWPQACFGTSIPDKESIQCPPVLTYPSSALWMPSTSRN